jgi:hypothetical protein
MLAGILSIIESIDSPITINPIIRLYQSLSPGIFEGWSILFQRHFVNAGGDSGANGWQWV